MYGKIVPFICCLMFSSAVRCQLAPVSKGFPAKTNEAIAASNQKIYMNPDQAPGITGGPGAWKKYLADSLDSSIPIKNHAPAGKYIVVIRGIVSYFGMMRDVQAETTFGYGMEAEAKRVIQNYHRWKPAINTGIPVNAFMRQEITFIVPAQ